MSGAVGNLLVKALSPEFYQATARNAMNAMYNYYHPLFRSGSVVPLWHSMIFVGTTMYCATYYARTHKVVQERRAEEKAALKEYYEKHGGGHGHH